MISVVDLGVENLSLIGNNYAFIFKQGPFHFQPSLKSPKFTVGSDRSVTGNDYGKRVSGKGSTHCTCSVWNSKIL